MRGIFLLLFGGRFQREIFGEDRETRPLDPFFFPGGKISLFQLFPDPACLVVGVEDPCHFLLIQGRRTDLFLILFPENDPPAQKMQFLPLADIIDPQKPECAVDP